MLNTKKIIDQFIDQVGSPSKPRLLISIAESFYARLTDSLNTNITHEWADSQMEIACMIFKEPDLERKEELLLSIIESFYARAIEHEDTTIPSQWADSQMEIANFIKDHAPKETETINKVIETPHIN